MNFSLFELSEVPEDKLSELVKSSLDEFAILKSIYNDDFIEDLLKDNHEKNYLLWLLSSKNPYTYETLKEISENLEILLENDSITHFKDKLQSKTINIFENYQLELYFASHYKKKGLNIELEPAINQKGKNPDFKVQYQNDIIFFETKNLYFENMISLDKFDFQLYSDLRKHYMKLVYSVYRDPNFDLSEYYRFRKFVQEKLSENKDASDFPKRYDFLNKEGKKCAKLIIEGKPNTKDYGYLSAIVDLHASEWKDRTKIINSIKEKLSQLVKNESNVIIIKSSQILTDYESIQDALFGAEKYLINKKTGNIIGSTRYGDRVFSPSKNSRISAILFYKKKYSNEKFEHNLWIFHNPYAKKPIPVEFFRDNNVLQFTIVRCDKTHIYLDWIQ
ncbi:MAG: hypothetical protein JRI56_04645 [Deltaproteobacteria bacterium]|nr:hypothetical protein [Deltaproteobacteria bacterium]